MINNINNSARNKPPTISLCMIVKNEEFFLPKCLNSVKGFVDEIVIVDTGSTDETVKIAERYNAKIYHHLWENSFSKARNYSLKYATSDWIFILDADEELDAKDASGLKTVIRECNADLLYLQVLDKTMEGEVVSVSNSGRVFRNHLGIKYEGTVHNYLKYNGNTKVANIKLFHYGYNLDEEKMERKFVRTSSLLKEQIKNDPSNPMPHHFLAIAYSDRNKNDECIDEALKAIKLFEQNNINTDVKLLTCYTASVAFYNKEDLVNAEYYALKSINSYPDYLDSYFILSSIYMRQKEYDKCIKATNKYLTILEKIKSNPAGILRIPYNNIHNAWHAHTRLAIVYFEQNRDNEGIQKLKKTVTVTEDNSDPYLSVGKYFLKQKNFKLTEKVLKLGLEDYPESKKILYIIAELYEEYNKPDNAHNYYKIILDLYPDEILAQYRIGLLLMKQSRFKDAINVFETLCSRKQDHIGALYNLGIAYEQINNIPDAKDAYNKISGLEPENAEVLVRLGSLLLKESYFSEAKQLFLKTIKLDKYLLESHLALSRIYLSLDDPESCVMSCNELLKCLNLPRNIIINSLNDLSRLYKDIGTTLLKQQREPLARFSFEIATLFDPGTIKAIQPNAADPVVTG
jgi:glycosyltransferase involved in cell wall biosynthesis